MGDGHPRADDARVPLDLTHQGSGRMQSRTHRREHLWPLTACSFL
jgi:hypothetical protein